MVLVWMCCGCGGEHECDGGCDGLEVKQGGDGKESPLLTGESLYILGFGIISFFGGNSYFLLKFSLLMLFFSYCPVGGFTALAQ